MSNRIGKKRAFQAELRQAHQKANEQAMSVEDRVALFRSIRSRSEHQWGTEQLQKEREEERVRRMAARERASTVKEAEETRDEELDNPPSEGEDMEIPEDEKERQKELAREVFERVMVERMWGGEKKEEEEEEDDDDDNDNDEDDEEDDDDEEEGEDE